MNDIMHIDDLVQRILVITSDNTQPCRNADDIKMCITGLFGDIIDVKSNIEETSLNEEDRKQRHVDLVIKSGIGSVLQLIRFKID